MTTERTDDRSGDRPDDAWERVGRAAERFARRMARDARTFAERLEEHAGEFARDVRREWPREWTCGGYRAHRRERGPSAADVRGVFEDVRGILKDVADGVDELLAHLFPEATRTRPADEPWTRVVANRDAACAGCGTAIAAGAEAYVRRGAGGTAFRCVACGVPGPGA